MSRIRADRYTNREGTGAPTFSEGVNVVGVTSMSGDLAVTNGTITGPSQLTISGITSSISDTAVDVFVYDTSKDSDGGDWRKRTQNTSWYNETLNTATRGSRKEFPAVAVIVAETGQVTIYDGDDPDLPMWMVINHSGAGIRATTAKNGVLYWGCSNASSDRTLYFISDRYYRWWTDSTFTGYFNQPISGRNGTLTGGNGGTQFLVDGTTNDVAMTVLPNTPIDDATGLPVPTIAVATDGGVSVIQDDGIVVQKTLTDAATDIARVEFTNDGFLLVNRKSYNYFVITAIGGSESALHPSGFTHNINYFRNDGTNFPGPLGPDGVIPGYGEQGLLKTTEGTDVAMADPYGLNFFNVTRGIASTSNMVAYSTSDYNTGYMQGDIKLATLSDTNATSQTGGTVADRSVNNNSVNVVGTVTRTAVATGADLVAYSGFSNSDYLQQPVNSDMQTGTGGFSVTAWFKTTSTATEYEGLIYYNRPGSIGEGFQIMMNNSNKGLYWYVYGPTNDSATTEITGLNDGVWHQIVATHIDGRQQVFIDGVLKQANSVVTGSMNDAQAQLHIGRWYGNADISDYWWRGSIALVRHSASIPSAEQIKKMYTDERHLFQENSKATLYGSSDAVTALGYDDTTNILHVGTSDGRSDFQGLRRINNTTVGITTAISASNELVAEQ